MIKAIIFDMDDTLYKELDFVYGGFKAVAKYISCKQKLDFYEVYNEIINEFKTHGRGKIFDTICTKHNLNIDISELIEVYRFHEPNINLYKDAQEIIKWCKSNNIYLGLITDGMSKVQWSKIKALGLENQLDRIIVSDDFGRAYWKPHVKTYTEMLKYLQITAKEAIYIGDNPNKDFIGCKKLGINTIRIIRETGDYMQTVVDKTMDADIKIKSLLEIKNIINKFSI